MPLILQHSRSPSNTAALCITRMETSFNTPDPLGHTSKFDVSKHVEYLRQGSVNPSRQFSTLSPCSLSHPATSDPLGQAPIQTELLSVVTDSILNIRALLGNISLVNEINFVINPIWVKGGVMSAGAISSNVFLGVKDSHSHQDFYQDPDEYIFDPDPMTRNNDFNLQSLRAICPLFHILWTFNLPQLLVALTGCQ